MVMIASATPKLSLRDDLICQIMVELDYACEGPTEVSTYDVAKQIVDLLEEHVSLKPRVRVPARTA